MPSCSISAFVSIACAMLLRVRVPRASNGVVWAASPSYDCRPANMTFAANRSAAPAPAPAGPARCRCGRSTDRPPAGSARRPVAPRRRSRAHSARRPRKKIVSGARAASATARSILPLPIDRGRDQQSTDAVIGKHLGLAQARGADANGARAISAFAISGTLVRLAVRAKPLVPRPQVRGHRGDVGFKRVEVEQQRRGGDVVAKLHRRAC